MWEPLVQHASSLWHLRSKTKMLLCTLESWFSEPRAVPEPQLSVPTTFAIPLVVFCSRSGKVMGLGLCSCINSQLCILVVRARVLPTLLQPMLGLTPSFSTRSGLLGLWSDVAVPWCRFPINHRPAANFWVGVWLWEFRQALLCAREALLLPLLCCSVAGFKIYIVAGIGIHICSQHMLLAQYQQMLLSGIKSRGAALLWSVTLWNGTVGLLLGVSVTYTWSSLLASERCWLFVFSSRPDKPNLWLDLVLREVAGLRWVSDSCPCWQLLSHALFCLSCAAGKLLGLGEGHLSVPKDSGCPCRLQIFPFCCLITSWSCSIWNSLKNAKSIGGDKNFRGVNN